MAYAINPAPNIAVENVGPEQVPIVYIDDLALDGGAAIRREAQSAQYQPEEVHMYPGIRSPLSIDYVKEALAPVYRELYAIYDVPREKQLRPTQACYSLITRPERELGAMQRIPHYDTCDSLFFAALHYLGEGDHGDTGLFQHRPTGYCQITEQRESNYLQSLQNYFDRSGAPAKRYITVGDEQFELYYRIRYRPNRMVIYPGNLLHSTLVNTSTDIDSSPVSGRLTANVFVRFQ